MSGRIINGRLDSRLGPLDYTGGYPSEDTSRKLYDELDFQHACQAYVWGVPAVGMQVLRKVMRENFNTPDGAMCTFLNFRDKIGMLTPNITTAYGFSFWNMAEQGPLVVEVPALPSAGALLDIWQRPDTDFGQTGPDGGKGGNYLILPPGASAPAGADGYYVFNSPTNQLWIASRGLDPDPAMAQAALAAHKIYSWDDRAAPPALVVNTVGGVPWDSTQPADLSYFTALHDILSPEPPEERDRFFHAMLRPLGLIPGQPFAPDDRQRRSLTEGALVGHAMTQNLTYANRFPEARLWPDRNWDRLMIVTPDQRADGYDQLDERGGLFYEIIGNSKGMQGMTVGVGQVYLNAHRDADEEYLDGGVNYILTVPANVPVAQFWSITLYDTISRGPIVTDAERADLSSRQPITVNADGAVDVYIGPDSPGADKAANWIPTAPGRGWFAYFRFYGPLEPYFDRSWKLPNIRKAR
ncbi:MAG: DUF1254 domain-containing protein [Thermomicrobiales bacterium]